MMMMLTTKKMVMKLFIVLKITKISLGSSLTSKYQSNDNCGSGGGCGDGRGGDDDEDDNEDEDDDDEDDDDGLIQLMGHGLLIDER